TQVRELHETEQYIEETHLDRDAVAKVFGVDDKGCVRGMGGGISKTELLASALPRKQLRQQVLKTRAVEDRVHSLEVTVETLMAGLSCNSKTNNANAQGVDGGGCQLRIQKVIVRNMRKSCVSLGCIDRNRPPTNDEYHLVCIEEICLPYESLCDGNGTFRDINIGDKIFWPQHSVSLLPTPMMLRFNEEVLFSVEVH
ncbi:hypothetical protein C5167_026769, partial [Papaver somniferum]